MSRVFVSARVPEDIIRPLRDLAEVDIWDGGATLPRAELRSRLEGRDGWLSMLTDTIDEDLLEGLPALRVISQMSVGVDNIDVAACRRRGILVGHTPDVLTETVADTAFALMAAAVRRLPEGERVVRSGEWGPWDPWHFLGGDLHRSKLGIVGMGRIGQAITRRAVGFEMDVAYVSPSPKPGSGAVQMELADLLRFADVVIIAAPLTEATRGLIGSAELTAMGEGAILVNIARGPLVDTDALVEALASGVIGGAALDVTDPEPLPSDHPLLSLPNCLVVPHIGSASVRARRAMAGLAVDNLVAGLSGLPMPAPLPGTLGEDDEEAT
jgi:lactate dehydrogenase-like 2-hydroxyacid dehydrogenase